jgi:hypothetical protein
MGGRFLSTAAAAFACAASAWAQDQQMGARTKAMGGSYTAFEDDPVSVWLNPAGIASQPDQASIAYQTYTAYPVQKERGPGNTVVFSEEAETVLADPEIIPSYLGLVFQLGSPESPLALGICYARPYLLNYAMDEIVSPTQTTYQPDNEVEQSLSRFRVALAKDFRLRKPEEGGFLSHVSIGLGLDVGYERWRFRTPTTDTSDTSAAFGFGGGVLVGLYDDTESFRLNLGAAYQSPVRYQFSISPGLLPAFDMPEQLNVGATFYLLRGFPLRLTLDLQHIRWEDTAADPFFSNQPKFEDVVNYSAGAEYRIPVGKVNLYPRVGYRRFDAPWEDEDDLPATGGFKLVLDTDGEAFHLFTFGVGISWTTEGGKVRSVDLAADVGGDAPNVALGYTHEF